MLAKKGNQSARPKQIKPKKQHISGIGLERVQGAEKIPPADTIRQRYLGNTAIQAMAKEGAPTVRNESRETGNEAQTGRGGADKKTQPDNTGTDVSSLDVLRSGRQLISAKKQDSTGRIHSTIYSRRFLIRHDIEWFINPFNGNGGSFDLIIDVDPRVRPKLSAQQIGAASAAVLAGDTGLVFKAEGAKLLVDYIAGQIENYDLQGPTFYIGIYFETRLKTFEERSYTTFIEQKRAASHFMDIQQIAVGNFDIAGEPVRTSGRPQWTRVKQRQVEHLIEMARRQKPPARDLPDKIVVWYKPENQSWYFNALVYLDTRGKKRVSYPVRLRPEESAEELFKRVRAAVPKALQKAEDERKQERTRTMPSWARRLEDEVRRELREQHRRDKEATDFPDGMVLVAHPWPDAATAQPGQKLGSDIFLQIWVEGGEAPHIRRKEATLPFALTPDTDVPHLVPYVRKLAAVLRQFEHTPLDKQPPLPADLDITPPDTEFALNAFPAEILANDLRPDQITVTGAKNEFGMLLDYEAVYGGGQLKDLYIASKLFQQYIHFFWKIYKVPSDLSPAKGEQAIPVAWPQRWQWLNETFNAKNRGDPDAAWRNISRLGEPVYEKNGPDPTTRVKFPSQTEDAGDYLVFCQTGHAPIGEYKLKRVSSVAYYPVRLRPIEREAQIAVSRRTGAIAALEAELEAIKAMLAEGGLESSQRQMIEAVQRMKNIDLMRYKEKEFRSFAENAAEEIGYATKVLGRVRQLEALLPGILKKAREAGTPDMAPSVQLAQMPELQDLYWYIIWEKKTLPGYEKELEAQIGRMQLYEKRAHEFEDELKPDSPYQYSPEVAFVSTLTGKVYPLVMMLGEAPDSMRNALSVGKNQGVAYSAVDITSSQTQKVYYGYSPHSGPRGHREAIDNAFGDFGDDATYGEGIIAVRIPSGRAGAGDGNHPGTGVKTYESKEGILQKVLWALSIIAAVAGAAALAATGVGAPAAAALFGAVAAGAGAITAIHSLSERSLRHKLEWDAETALDIISIVSVIPLAAGVRVARLPRTIANMRSIQVTEQFVRIYGWGETAATVILVPTKLAQDIQRIENDPDLTPDQRKALIREAKLGAFQTGLMMIGSGAAALHQGAKARLGFDPVDNAALNQQIELMELEGWGKYKTLAERGYLDDAGQWTTKVRTIAPPETGAGPSPAEILPTASRQRGRTAVGMGGEPPGKKPSTPGTRRPVGDYYVSPDSPEYHRLLHEGWSAEMVRSGLKPDLPAIVAKGGKPLRHGTFQADIKTPDQAYKIYEEALARAGGREVAIFRNTDTGRYAVTVGTPFEVGPPWRGNWEGVLHYHQNPANILTYRMPAPADVEGAMLAAFRAEGRLVTEFIEHPIPGGGRGRVAYSVLYEDGRFRITVETIRPDGKPIKQTFSSLKNYQAEYIQRTRYADPQSDEYKWIMRDAEHYMDEKDTRTMAGGRKAKDTGRKPISEDRPGAEKGEGIRPGAVDEDEPTKVFRQKPEKRATPAEAGGEPEAPVPMKKRDEQPLPEATVLQLARPERITAAYIRDVYRTYRNMWADDPSREAGLYHNPVSGDFILVQGNEQAVMVSTTGKQSPLSTGKAQRWKEVLDEGMDVGQWELVRHYHPAAPGSEFVSHVGRLPSGAVKDMDVIYFESVRAGGKARTSTIDYLTPEGPDSTTFGFNPEQPQPLWINYPDEQTGARRIRRFPDLEAYHQWVRETFNVDLGEVPKGQVPGEPLPTTDRRSPQPLKVSSTQTPGEPPRLPVRPLDREKALGYHFYLDEGQMRTPDDLRIIRVPTELYDAAWQRANRESSSIGKPPQFGFVDEIHGQVVLNAQRPDIHDPGGRLRRSADNPRTDEPRHYHAREYFGETSQLGGEEARYFAEANLRDDGIVDLDFHLRIQQGRGGRRSSQLRGQEEFNRALEHFRRRNGEDSVKGIRGDWDTGDNLRSFNDRFIKHLADNLSRDEAFRQAALETYTGRWAKAAGYTKVRREIARIDPNTGKFEQVVVIFEKAAGPSGPAGPVPPRGGQPPPAPPGKTPPGGHLRGMEELSPVTRRRPASPQEAQRPGDRYQEAPRHTITAAGQAARDRAQNQLRQVLSAQVKSGGMIPVIEVEGVRLHDVRVRLHGTECRISYFGIENVSAPKGNGLLVHQALERAAVDAAMGAGAQTVRVNVETVVNPQWQKRLDEMGYTKFVMPRREGEFGFQAVMSKVFPVPKEKGQAEAGGRNSVVTAGDVTRLARDLLKRPIRPMTGEIHFFENWLDYLRAFRRINPEGEPPLAFHELATGHVYLSPRRDLLTILHESIHKVAVETFPWGHELLGKFLTEGITESIVRRVLPSPASPQTYDLNVRFVHMLQRRVGQATVENAVLHGAYRSLRDAVRRALGGSEADTLEFFTLLRSLENRFGGVNDPAALRRVSEFLARMRR